MDPPAPGEHISSGPDGVVAVQSPPEMSSVDSSKTPSVIDTMDPKTAEKVQAYQSQIKILLYNYQVSFNAYIHFKNAFLEVLRK